MASHAPKKGGSMSAVALEGFDGDVLKRAIVGLSKYLRQKEHAQDLLTSRGAVMTLTFGLARIPPGVRPKPLAITVPHPLYLDSECSACLITRDPQKLWKERIAAQWNPDAMNGMQPPKVIGLSKLKKNYPTMAARRDLLRSADIFLCDHHIIEQMPRLLGRTFIDAGKLPIDIKIQEIDLIKRLEERLRQVFFRLRTGTTVSVKLGFSNQPAKHLYQNAMCILRAVATFFNPTHEELAEGTYGVFRNNDIMHIHLTATDAPSLPIFARPSLVAATAAHMKPAENANPKKDKRKTMKSPLPASTKKRKLTPS